MPDMDCIAGVPEQKVNLTSNRRLKVGYASTYPEYERIPAITMKGQWLEAVGFSTGTMVEVQVMPGCIVLTARAPEPELTQALHRMTKMSARKQKQGNDFIGVISGKTRVK